MTCPAPDLWKARRACFLAVFPEEEDQDGSDLSFVPIPMEDLQPGDIFTLEAHPENGYHDPLDRLTAVERLFRVDKAPYFVDGVCQVDCERL